MYIPTLIFVIYVVLTSLIYGIPNSLSQTYLLIHKSRSILFSIVMMLISFTTLVIMISRVNDLPTILLTVLGIVGIMFVGVFAQYLDSFQKIFHFLGAGIAAISTTIWTFIKWDHTYLLFIPLLSLSILLPLLLNKKKLTFWAEMACFTNYFIIANLVYYNLI